MARYRFLCNLALPLSEFEVIKSRNLRWKKKVWTEASRIFDPRPMCLKLDIKAKTVLSLNRDGKWKENVCVLERETEAEIERG